MTTENGTSLPIRIFAIGDVEWWIGSATPEQMRTAYREAYGDEKILSDSEDDLPRALDEHELSLYRYYYGPEDEAPTRELTRSFAEQLQIEIAGGVPIPRMFAAEEL